MRILVGHTGFIGKNLLDQTDFDFLYNSSNIEDIKNAPSGCDIYLSCLPAEKWKVNKNPLADYAKIISLIDTLKTNKYRNVNLISTIDVYCNSPLGSDETFIPSFTNQSYGSNRFAFEEKVKEQLSYERLKIFRLPALFGKHLKKNIIFDVLNQNNIDLVNRNSSFQWYDISDLSQDIAKYNNSERVIFNLFPEPIETPVLLRSLYANHIGREQAPITYDYKTTLSETGYLYSKLESLIKIQRFVDDFRSK